MSLRQRCSLPSPHLQTTSPWKLRAKLASGTCTTPYRGSACSGTITTSAAIYPDEVREATQRSRQTTQVPRGHTLPRSRSDSPGSAVKTTQSLRAPVAKSMGQHRRHSPLAELPTLLSRHLKGRRRATLSGLQTINREPSNASSIPHDGKIDDEREHTLDQSAKENNSPVVPLRSQNNDAAMVSLADLGRSAVPSHVDVEREDTTHHNTNKTVDPELVDAAMIAGLDDTRILKSSQATARLLLLHRFQSSRAHCGGIADREGAFISETGGGIGRATIERLFFSSLPKDLIEIVAVQEVIEADATNDFFRLLAAKGSFNVDVRFRIDGSNVSDVTTLAGKTHQLASQSAGDNDENVSRRMLIVLIIADSSCAFNESAALSTCLVTYRMSDRGNSLAHGARQKRFAEVLDHAVERAALLTEGNAH